MMLEDKIFFNPGDLVILRHPIPNRPAMYVVGRVMQTIKKGANLESLFKGIRCILLTLPPATSRVYTNETQSSQKNLVADRSLILVASQAYHLKDCSSSRT